MDVVTATEVSAGAPSEVEMVWALAGQDGLDIGPATLERFNAELQGRNWWSGTARWACSRSKQFAHGTNQLAQMLAGWSTTGRR